MTYCAFEGNRVVGEIMLLPRLNKDRLIIDSFHVSSDYRRRGIGRALLDAARQEALKRGRMLYMLPAAVRKKQFVFTPQWASARVMILLFPA